MATVAHAMAIGIDHAATRHQPLPTCHQATAASRFQPTCRLGIAAYLLTSAGGCSTRYEDECWVTVSTNSGLNRRGGATGNVA